MKLILEDLNELQRRAHEQFQMFNNEAGSATLQELATAYEAISLLSLLVIRLAQEMA